MLINKKGNILNSTENVICHQVNEYGIMGGGLALQVATQYPEVEKIYKEYCTSHTEFEMYGTYQLCKVSKDKYIANCFTQSDFITNLNNLERCFMNLLAYCKSKDLSVCIPKNYGCGIAIGNWEQVSNLFENLSNLLKIDIVVYEYE